MPFFERSVPNQTKPNHLPSSPSLSPSPRLNPNPNLKPQPQRQAQGQTSNVNKNAESRNVTAREPILLAPILCLNPLNQRPPTLLYSPVSPSIHQPPLYARSRSTISSSPSSTKSLVLSDRPYILGGHSIRQYRWLKIDRADALWPSTIAQALLAEPFSNRNLHHLSRHQPR